MLRHIKKCEKILGVFAAKKIVPGLFQTSSPVGYGWSAESLTPFGVAGDGRLGQQQVEEQSVEDRLTEAAGNAGPQQHCAAQLRAAVPGTCIWPAPEMSQKSNIKIPKMNTKQKAWKQKKGIVNDKSNNGTYLGSGATGNGDREKSRLDSGACVRTCIPLHVNGCVCAGKGEVIRC